VSDSSPITQTGEYTMMKSLKKLLRLRHSNRLITNATKKHIALVLLELQEEKNSIIDYLIHMEDIHVREDDQVYFGFLGKDCAREWWLEDAFYNLPQFNPNTSEHYKSGSMTTQEFWDVKKTKSMALSLVELYKYSTWMEHHRAGVKTDCSLDCTGNDCSARNWYRVWEDSSKEDYRIKSY